MRAFLFVALVLLSQSCIRAEDNGVTTRVEAAQDLNSVRTVQDLIQGNIASNIESIPRRVADLLNNPTPQPDNTVPPTTTTPRNTTQPPATTAAPNFLNPIVTARQATRNQPYVEQAGSTPLFPSPTNRANFIVGPGTSRYLVIGDWGRIGSRASIGAPECPTGSFSGNNEEQGALQQLQTAQLADQVCGLLGGCQAVIGTGDNFYQCGVYPGDTTNRFNLDWANIYQTAATPNLRNLTWYQVFGNHDMVINGSVEAQIAYTTQNPNWQIPSNYFFSDLPTVAGGPRIRAFFVDANPFIANYNQTGGRYNTPYFRSKLNAQYIDGQIAWLQTNLAASTADFNLVVGHYPLFGSAAQYGFDRTGRATSPYPGNFNAWEKLLRVIYDSNKVDAYLNGHDHVCTVGNPNQPNAPIPWNGHTAFMTSGAGSWGEPADTCGPTDSFLYTNGGNGGFIVVSSNATVFQSDFFVLGSLFSQCTITSFADKTRAPIISDNCALGQPNACCDVDACYGR